MTTATWFFKFPAPNGDEWSFWCLGGALFVRKLPGKWSIAWEGYVEFFKKGIEGSTTTSTSLPNNFRMIRRALSEAPLPPQRIADERFQFSKTGPRPARRKFSFRAETKSLPAINPGRYFGVD